MSEHSTATDDGPRDAHHNTEHILTVGQLREWLTTVPDDTQVVVDDGEGWYDNVKEVVVPPQDFSDEYSAVTLYRGVTVDSRQF